MDLGVGLGDRGFAGEEAGEVFDGAAGLTLDALVGAAADVRGEDGAGEAEERVIGGRRLLVEHVGAVADFAGLDSGDERGEFDEFAAAGVDDDGVGLEEGEAAGVDQAFGFFGELGVERNEVGLFEGFVEILDALEAIPAGEIFFPIVGKHDHAQAEGAGANGDFFGDAAKADEGEGFAAEFVAGDARPAAGGDVVGLADEVADDREEEGEGVLGDGGVIDAGGEEDGDLQIGGGFDVDLVEADAVFGNDLEAGEGFLDDGACEGVVAAEVGIKLAGEFQHARLGERAALADELEVGGGEHLVVDAGRVLK